jgi:hypothetical protein
VLAGNHSVDAMVDAGAVRMPWVWLDVDDREARRIMADDNRTAELGGYDQAMLLENLRALDAAGDLDLTAWSHDDLADLERAADASTYVPPVDVPTLADRFVVPPFTVLDARAGAWRERKTRWLSLGIQSEVGRGGPAAPGAQVLGAGPSGESLRDNADQYRQKEGRRGQSSKDMATLDAAAKSIGYGRGSSRTIKGQEDLTRIKPNLAGALAGDHSHGRTLAQGLQAHRGADGSLEYTETTAAGVSIFDPVVCELAYRWFSPPGGHVLDPFAGGSVRGVVAGALGRSYTGVELRAEQVAANDAQRPLLDRYDAGDRVRWLTGDSRRVLPTLDTVHDLVFSCPPYADLEVYSDDPADLSTLPYDAFKEAYRFTIRLAVDLLRDDRFAVWVVGEVRDRQGRYRDFVGDTVQAFRDAGAAYYNEAILVTPAGSLPIRAGRQFDAGRKLGKTHQQVLVFCKGDPKAATITNTTINPTNLTPGEAVTCRRCLALEPAPVAAPARAPRTWDATAAETYVCAGDCGQEKPARSFPTTGKDGQRGVECRSCRDARKVAA